MDNSSEEAQKSYVNDVGHCAADFNEMCNAPLNEDFELKSALPYGKFLSDMTGLCMGLNNFDIAIKPELYHQVAAPIYKLPPNPFTGETDAQILLDCMNAIDTEEVQEEFESLFLESYKHAEEFDSFRNVVRRAERFNSSLEAVILNYSKLERPPKYTRSRNFGKSFSRKSDLDRKDTAKLTYLAALHCSKRVKNVLELKQ
ncbi:mediator complex subunit MED8 [Cardiosporidium cionae]|uniref:Mediator complex subunit MED8 n=1 Tax=Cardiosporidium cionae TaxID=476202 RepID=A0ABQ7J5U6_9APIC|nr:mediator complex subunit MED8 [Cardiosporidium cionae]|eukprot:KAF8819376.1 mediator complex subunit MED8 [Cardiosporidium cionae]